MAKITIHHDEFLLCRCVHGPSGAEWLTDVSKESMGGGSSFDPSDLTGVSLGACILTTIALSASTRGMDITGAKAEVELEMVEDPRRRIGRVKMTIAMPQAFPARARRLFEVAARSCPVHNTLHPRTRIDIDFNYPEE